MAVVCTAIRKAAQTPFIHSFRLNDIAPHNTHITTPLWPSSSAGWSCPLTFLGRFPPPSSLALAIVWLVVEEGVAFRNPTSLNVRRIRREHAQARSVQAPGRATSRGPGGQSGQSTWGLMKASPPHRCRPIAVAPAHHLLAGRGWPVGCRCTRLSCQPAGAEPTGHRARVYRVRAIDVTRPRCHRRGFIATILC